MNFSVIIAVYGKDDAVFFDKALHSIFNQSYSPSEVVLVVDGPIPSLINKVIVSYSNTYDFMKVHHLIVNQGHAYARQKGIEISSNELIAIMDSDDIASYDRFEKQIKCFESNSNIDVLGGQITEFLDEESRIIGIRKVPLDNDSIKLYMKLRCPFNQVTVMMRKSLLLQVGGYQDWFCNEDYYLWIRMFQCGAIFQNLPDILVNVRVGKEMYARRGGLKYCMSELKLQSYMFNNNVITFCEYIINVLLRICIQLLMPNSLRGFIFRRFFRKSSDCML